MIYPYLSSETGVNEEDCRIGSKRPIYFFVGDASASSLRYQPKTRAAPDPAKAVMTGSSKTWRIQSPPKSPAV